MPLWARGSELLPVWPPALLFLPLLSFFGSALCPGLKPLQQSPPCLKGRPSRAPRNLKTTSLRLQVFPNQIFPLTASKHGEPFDQPSELLSSQGNSRWGSVRCSNYSSLHSHTLSHTPSSFVTRTGFSLVSPFPQLSFHLAEVSQAVWTRCSPFSGAFLCPPEDL